MTTRRRLPPLNEPDATDRSITKSQQPTGAAARRTTSSGRVQDRRGEPPPNPIDHALGTDVDQAGVARWRNRPLTAAGRRMVAGASDIGRPDLSRNYSTSMAANMDSYFRRLMAQQSPQAQSGDTRAPTRYGEIPYSDIDQTQQQFRENQRQAMLRVMARRVLEGGQPSTSQMLTKSYQKGFDIPEIAGRPVDPIFGQDDRRQYPDGEQYYTAGDIGTLADALAERRDLMSTTLVPEGLAEEWNRGNRPFSPSVMRRYQR